MWTIFPQSDISSSSSLLQWWTQRAWRHHLHQRPEDLVGDWCQCRHQAGRQLENSCAPWKWGRYPHGCSHGDRPLTLHNSAGAGAMISLSPVDLILERGFFWCTRSLWPKAIDTTHAGKFWLCLERNDCTDALKTVLCFHVFSLLVFNALINATAVWSQT